MQAPANEGGINIETQIEEDIPSCINPIGEFDKQKTVWKW